MAEPAQAKGTARVGFAQRLWRLAKTLFLRLYALAILMVVLWTGYAAIAFLVESVFTPSAVPPKFQDWGRPVALQETPGIHAAELGQVERRSPLGHYHMVQHWPNPARLEGCVTSGCHHPLPHTRSKEVRAFANLHSTFLTCMACHDDRIDGPMPAVWVDGTTGEKQGVPAALRLMALLRDRAETIERYPAQVHEEIVGLLQAMIRVVPRDESLNHLLVELQTSQPGSPVWRRSVGHLEAALPNYTRGEYGAMIVAEARMTEVLQFVPTEQVKEYLDAGPESAKRKQMHAQFHQHVMENPRACLKCHGDQPGRLDYAALGYTQERAEALSNVAIARQMEQLLQGQPFYLPNLMEGGRGQ